MLIIFMRSIILYVVVVICVKLMGKRQIGQLQPSELVVTILISNIATMALDDISTPMVMGLSAIFTLVSLDVIMSWVTLKSLRIRRLVCGRPRIVIRDGIIIQQELKSLRFSLDDLMEGIRSANVFDISEVQLAVVETTGAISVYQKFESRTVSNGDMNIKGSTINPPSVIINDGELIESGLNETGLGRGWVDVLLQKNNAQISNVFLLSADKNGKHHLVMKDASI